MSMLQYERWYHSKEKELWKYLGKSILARFGVLIILGLSYATYLIVSGIINSDLIIFDFISGKDIIGAITMIALIFYFILLFVFLSLFSSVSRVEYISCLLFKLANQLTTQSDDKEIKCLLKQLNKVTKFDITAISVDLFKKETKVQEKFYKQLEDFPKRIYHALINKKLSDIEPKQIEKLAYYLHTDDNKKISELDAFSNDYKETEVIQRNVFSIIRSMLRNKWFQVLFWIIIVAGASFLALKYCHIEINTVYLGAITLIGIISYIIFKK